MYTYNIIDKNFEKLLALDLREVSAKENLIFFCVGCDKWTIDCFAPMIGTILKHKYNIKSLVFGELDNCITKTNYLEYFHYLKDKFPNYKILVIDTALSDYQNLGFVKFSKDGLVVGSALHNDCAEKIGDYFITANIGVLPFNSNSCLPMPSLGKVYYYAKKISCAIAYALL